MVGSSLSFTSWPHGVAASPAGGQCEDPGIKPAGLLSQNLHLTPVPATLQRQDGRTLRQQSAAHLTNNGHGRVYERRVRGRSNEAYGARTDALNSLSEKLGGRFQTSKASAFRVFHGRSLTSDPRAWRVQSQGS